MKSFLGKKNTDFKLYVLFTIYSIYLERNIYENVNDQFRSKSTLRFALMSDLVITEQENFRV